MQAVSPEAEMKPRITVVIPHLNQPDLLERCIASVMAGTRKPDEIIVVDNGSRTLPEAVCAAWPGTRLICEPVPGPGPARNLGIAHATGDVLAFIDSDCIATPGWLAGAERAMADPKAMILGGDVRIALRNPDRIEMMEAYECVYSFRMERYILREGYCATLNMVARRAVMPDVGPFGGIDIAEDRDWGQRATARGYRIRFVPDMQVLHPARETFADLKKKWDRHMAHDFVQARGSVTGKLKWLIKTLAMGVSPLAELPRILASDRISGPRSRALAFAGLTRIRIYRCGRMFWLMAGGSPEKLAGRWNRPAGNS